MLQIMTIYNLRKTSNKKFIFLTCQLCFHSSPSSLPHPDQLWGPPSLLSSGYQVFSPQRQSCQGMKLTTHLHLVIRLLKCGAVPLLPNYSFMVWYLVKHRDSFTFNRDRVKTHFIQGPTNTFSC